jgi:hypothetical protein
MKRLLNICAAFLVIAVFVFSFVNHASAESFNRNNIIDDGVFDNASSMSAASINNWLNANFPSSCISTNNHFASPDPIGYNPTQGFLYGGNVSGGQVIYDAAQAYGLNPQVLIATLQKESSVVSGDASYHCQYINTAMGYGCPDSGSCPTNPATMSGFSKQVIHAAWLLKFGEQRSKGNTGWAVIKGNWDNSDDPETCYGGPMTQGTFRRCSSGSSAYYDGYTTIDGISVHMDDGATAALYWYTPHFSGNQNFYNIFTAWFGTVRSSPFFRVGTSPRVYIIGANNTYYYVPNSLTLSFYGLGREFNTIYTYASSYTSGLTFRGTLPLVSQFDGAAPIYLVDSGGTLHHFPNESSFNNYGYSIGNQANLPGWILSKYTISSDMRPVVKQNGNPAVYYIQAGKRSHIGNMTAYTTMGSPVYSSQPSVTVSIDYVNTLPWGAPIIPPNLVVKSSDTQSYGFWNGSSLQSINGSVITNAGFSPDYTSVSAAINQLPVGGSTLSNRAKSSGGVNYILDGSSKLSVAAGQLTNFGMVNGDFVTTSDNFLNRFSSGTMQNLIRVKNTNPVYLINSAQLSHFFDPSDLTGLGYNWGQVGVVSASTANLFTNSGKSLFHDGKLVRQDNTPAVYLINGSASRLWVPNEPIFYNYGYSMNNVVSVPASALGDYPAGSNLSQVVKNGSGTFWLVDSGKKHQISSTLLGASYYSINQGSTLTLTDANIGGVSSGSNLTDLIEAAGNPKVYRVENGQKRWFTSESSFSANGGVWSQISLLSPSYVNSIPSGTDIN